MRIKAYGTAWLMLVLLLSSCKETQLNITNVGDEGAGATQIASVSGQVVDNQGNPVAGVVVASLPFGREFELDAIGRKKHTAIVTDDQGHYQITDLPQASYRLNFLASGFAKVSIALGPIDFLPDNLVDGHIQKAVVLQPYPATNDGEAPAVALFDPEEKKRMTEFLTTYGIHYRSVLGSLTALNHNNFNVLVLGLDSTVFTDVNELIEHKQIIDNFIAEGGSVYLGQHNDFSVENTPMPFLTGDQQYILHTEDAPLNDFESGTIVQPSHPLVAGVAFNDWGYIEPGQQTVKSAVTFDAAVKDSFDTNYWQLFVTTPSEDFSSGNGDVPANSDVIIAQYNDPRNGGHIVLNQAAFYQATFGDETDTNAVKLSANVAAYIKQLNK